VSVSDDVGHVASLQPAVHRCTEHRELASGRRVVRGGLVFCRIAYVPYWPTVNRRHVVFKRWRPIDASSPNLSDLIDGARAARFRSREEARGTYTRSAELPNNKR
jgi:hypothetical protein